MNKKSNYNYKDLEKAQAKKRNRLYKRFLKMLNQNKDVFFLTFTFSEKTIKTTSQKTRERYIKAFLNEQAENYILNCDFGKTTSREHYHAAATPKYKYFVYDLYKYGYLKGEILNKLERFKRANKTPQEIAEYLTQHATKNSTKNSKIIYSRRLKKDKTKNSDLIIFKSEQIDNKLFMKNLKKAAK